MPYDYSAIEAVLGKRDHFPNTSSVAYFDLKSQTIHLNKISREAYIQALKDQRIPELRGYLGTMMHEVTHWADLVGTLWGREYLRSVFAALRLLDRINTTGSEAEFYRFVDLHDRTRRLMLDRYFRTVHPSPNPHDHRRPWGIQFSAGREFDPSGRPDTKRPILFTKFLDNADGGQIARQPIVAGSLLEVNAMWSEMCTNFEAISALPDMEKQLEGVMYTRELLGYLYHPDLTLYTAPAHLLAHFARITDVGDAYKLASAVAHVALNMSAADFEKLMPPASMAAWEELFAGFKTSQDRGFAYAVICACGSHWKENDDVREWVDHALDSAGLGSSAAILAAAQASMQGDTVTDPDTSLGRAERYLLSLGELVFNLRSSSGTALTPGRIAHEQLIVPPAFDQDGVLLPLGSAKFDLSQFNPHDLHAASAALHTWTNNFLSACR